MVKERRRKRSFLAHDENGKDHVINVWVEILDGGSPENPDEETEGTSMLETRDGQRLNWRGKGEVSDRSIRRNPHFKPSGRSLKLLRLLHLIVPT